MFYSGDNIGAIVADVGSYSCRIGYAGEDSPRAFFPSAIGTVDDNPSHHQFSPYKYAPGAKIQFSNEESLITDWDLYENAWDYALKNFVKTDLAGQPVLVTEKPYNTPELRHKLCEFMFEKHGAVAFFLAKDATLACYACGRTSGLVVDCGASGTLVTPVVDGWAELKGVIKSPVGGRLMDAYTSQLVAKRLGQAPRPLFRLSKTPSDIPGFSVVSEVAFNEPIDASFDAFMNLELARDVKEATCLCSDSTLSQAEGRLSLLPTTPYELPDGTVVDMGVERYMVPELFFEPSLFAGREEVEAMFSASRRLPQRVMPHSAESLPQMVQSSLLRCDADASVSSLWSNVVLSGGNSCYRGLQDRLKAELEYRSQGNKVRVFAASEVERGDKADKMKSVIDRAICPWLGGSIMGSLGSFHEVWISKREYEEHGPQIVDIKCP